MDTANVKPEDFCGNWIFIVLLVLFGAVLFATALGMVVLTFTMAFPLHHYTLSRALHVFGWGSGSLATAFSGRAMWIQAVQMAHYVAHLDFRGLDFRFGSKHHTRDIFFAWNQIAAVQHKRTPGGQSYCVVGKDKRSVEFTAFTFFHPKKLALQIAAHINQSLQEIKL
jgi:hypothetical protein